MDEEREQRHPQPPVDPVSDGEPPARQEIAAAEREIGAGEPRPRVPDIAAEGELGQEDDEARHGQTPDLGRDAGGRGTPPRAPPDPRARGREADSPPGGWPG